MNLIDESTILSMIDDSSDLFVNLTNRFRKIYER